MLMVLSLQINSRKRIKKFPSKEIVLANRRMELQFKIDEKKDLDKNIQAFKKVIQSFLNLDMSNPQDLKQLLQRLIEKIEVFEGGKIVIHYNLAQ